MHAAAPTALYRPTGHRASVRLDVPAGQPQPDGHTALQFTVTAPTASPYRPGAHSPTQLSLTAPGASLYLPGGHGVHSAAPA